MCAAQQQQAGCVSGLQPAAVDTCSSIDLLRTVCMRTAASIGCQVTCAAKCEGNKTVTSAKHPETQPCMSHSLLARLVSLVGPVEAVHPSQWPVAIRVLQILACHHVNPSHQHQDLCLAVKGAESGAAGWQRVRRSK